MGSETVALLTLLSKLLGDAGVTCFDGLGLVTVAGWPILCVWKVSLPTDR